MRCLILIWMMAREMLEDGKDIIWCFLYIYADENLEHECLMMLIWWNYSKFSAGLTYEREVGGRRGGGVLALFPS